jgi:hypothetical protein
MSASNIMDLDELMCDSEEFALDLLRDGADSARALVGNLPKANADALSEHPIVAVGYALLVHLDRRAEEQNFQRGLIIEGLRAIKESVDFLTARSHSADPSNESQPGSTEGPSDFIWLKEWLEHARPKFSDAEYGEAITRLQRLAGV